MAWSTPRTWSTGEVVTAANMNTYLSNNLTFLGGAVGATVATSQTTTSASYTDLATAGPAVTVATQTTAIVTVSAQLQNATAGNQALMSFAVSGATTIAAADGNATYYTPYSGGAFGQQGVTIFLSNLTAGSNTFTAKYKSNGGTTATFINRNICVIPLTV